LASGAAVLRQESALSRAWPKFAMLAKAFSDGTIDASSIDEMNIVKLGMFLFLVTAGLGCAHGRYLPGTKILANAVNQEIIDTIEEYRDRLMAKNVDGLLLLASDKYFEDGGTPQANDDYGFDGLAIILRGRLQRVESIRYNVQYRSIRIQGDRAEVEAFLTGAFELQSETGERYRRVSDYHRFLLERSTNGGSSKWKFLSGM
jgi:hypothetical protein